MTPDEGLTDGRLRAETARKRGLRQGQDEEICGPPKPGSCGERWKRGRGGETF